MFYQSCEEHRLWGDSFSSGILEWSFPRLERLFLYFRGSIFRDGPFITARIPEKDDALLSAIASWFLARNFRVIRLNTMVFIAEILPLLGWPTTLDTVQVDCDAVSLAWVAQIAMSPVKNLRINLLIRSNPNPQLEELNRRTCWSGLKCLEGCWVLGVSNHD